MQTVVRRSKALLPTSVATAAAAAADAEDLSVISYLECRQANNR